ncbi:hypothetical protein FB451DRAFT_777718 [Mycena latifolia]|nr:hypothetical protein FB451DRAFT_777718 [Mycena latifolia]
MTFMSAFALLFLPARLHVVFSPPFTYLFGLGRALYCTILFSFKNENLLYNLLNKPLYLYFQFLSFAILHPSFARSSLHLPLDIACLQAALRLAAPAGSTSMSAVRDFMLCFGFVWFGCTGTPGGTSVPRIARPLPADPLARLPSGPGRF